AVQPGRRDLRRIADGDAGDVRAVLAAAHGTRLGGGDAECGLTGRRAGAVVGETSAGVAQSVGASAGAAGDVRVAGVDARVDDGDGPSFARGHRQVGTIGR